MNRYRFEPDLPVTAAVQLTAQRHCEDLTAETDPEDWCACGSAPLSEVDLVDEAGVPMGVGSPHRPAHDYQPGELLGIG